MSATIVLADDHRIVRQGLRALLEAQNDLRVIAETGDGLEAVELVERLRPDVLVVDVMMPGLNGLEVTRQVRQRWPTTKVVVLSMRASKPFVAEALRHGAGAYVLKASGVADLVLAVREVIAGGQYLSPPLSREALGAFARNAEEATLDLYETLTGRERQVLQLAAEGLTNAEIGARLSISPHTAMTHRSNLMRKLGLHSQADLARFALRRGVLPFDE
ncbi:MAG: response regulator transcription factor [Chloroflexi bacterium]|nr:response regulator transcription factor [Chloroflexota bacterium]